MAAQWRAFAVEGSALNDKGERYAFEWKALLDVRGDGWWQCREILVDLNQLLPGKYLHHWWVAKRDIVESAVLAAGLCAEQLVKCSRKARAERARRQGADVVEDNAGSRQEWLFSTKGLVITLMALATTSRKRVHKTSAHGYLAALLAALLPADCVRQLGMRVAELGVLQQCRVGARGQAACVHMQPLLESLADTSLPEQGVVARVLLGAGHACRCAQVARFGFV